MSQTSIDDPCVHEMGGEAVKSGPTRKSIRIIGISVGRMEPDKKSLYVKIKLDGVQFSKLPPVDAEVIPERRKWSFSLNLQKGSQLTVELLHKRRLHADEQLAQIALSFDTVQSFLDSVIQDQSLVEYQIHASPGIWLDLDSGAIAPQTRLGVVIQKSKELSSVLERLGKWQRPLAMLLETSTAVSEVHPISKAMLATFNVIYRKLQAQDKCNEQVRDLAESMANMCCCICDVEQFARLPQLRAAMEEAHRLMERIENIISLWAAQGTADFVWDDSVRLEIEKLIKDYNIFQRQFDRGIAVSSAASIDLVLKLQQEEKDEKLLEQLQPKGVESVRPATECMEGTREAILSGVDSYLDNFEEPNILWIRGHPGVGKSALASTIASRLHAQRRLGSYFVFERAKADITTPSALWRRVGYDLAEQWPSSRQCIVGQLKAKEVRLNTPNTEDLFEQIVERALKEPVDIPPGRLPVIIIDGLDECGGLEGRRSAGRRELLKTLKRWPRLSAKFKLIITSRPEEDIARALSPISFPIDLFSGTAVTSETSEDIHTFFIRRFREIAECYPESLARDWPGLDVTNKLTARAAGLFIWAKTVVDFVDEGIPTKRLQDITDRTPRLGDMGHLYSLILNTHFPSPAPDELHWFQVLVGAIIIAKRPLSRSECIHLLEIERPMLDFVCNGLRSVLDPGDTLRFTHQSFVDFLLNPEGCPKDFFINPGERHYFIDACLRTMSTKLCFNICNLTTSMRLNVDVPDIRGKVAEGIPSHLEYSCCFWTDHLSSAPFDEGHIKTVKKVVEDKFLYWLEVMSLLNEMNRVAPALKVVLGWSKPANDDEFQGFVKDAVRFVLAFRDAIEQSAPHIYISALPFAPEQSRVAQVFLHRYPRTIAITTGKPACWPSTLFVLNFHQSLGGSVAFSRDQRYFASCGDTVCICDAENGNLVSGPFMGPPTEGSNIAFSPDGRRLVVSGPMDKTVRIWDAKSGDELLCLLSEDAATCMAYSDNGQRIATCSWDATIRVWDAESGRAIGGPIKGQTPRTDTTPVIVFSTDGRYIILGYCPGSVEIWDICSGKRDKLIPLGTDLHVVALSLDGQFMAGRSDDGIARIWNIKTREPPIHLNLLEGQTDSSRLFAYSANGKRLASISPNDEVRVWDILKGKMLFGPLSVHSPSISTVVLSPDGTKLVSGLSDGTVRMWDLDHVEVSSLSGPADTYSQNRPETTSDSQEKTERPLPTIPKDVFHIRFFPCGKKLMSSSSDGTRVWDMNTGKRLLGPLLNESSGAALVFSPDGEWFASLSGPNRSICVWSATGKLIRQSPPMVYPFGSQLAILPNGRSLVSCQFNHVCIWDVETMDNPVQHLLYDYSPFTSVLSLDGTKVIYLNREHQIRMWNTLTQKPFPVRFQAIVSFKPVVLPSPSGEPIVVHLRKYPWEAIAFSQSGKLVCSLESNFQVCDVETGKEVAAGSFNGLPSILTISPDDRFIVASIGCGFQAFDIAHRRICGSWYGHTGRVTDLKFSPDGKKIVSSSDNGTMRISDFAESSPDQSPKESRDPYMDGCKLESGWVKTIDEELLFWVPPWNRDGLWWSRSTLVIAEAPTKLDLTKFEYGDNWQKCRDSKWD